MTTARDVIAEALYAVPDTLIWTKADALDAADLVLSVLLSAPDSIRQELAALLNSAPRHRRTSKMNCTQCGNTGLVPVEKGPAGATYTVLARCKCQTDTITIPRAEYEALMAAVQAAKQMRDDLSALELHGDGAHDDSCSICRAIVDFDAAFGAAGIQDNTND